MTRRSDRRRLFRKSWGFKFVCYSLVLLTSILFLLEPVARVIAKETIFSQVVNQAVTTTRNSIISKEISESSQSITNSLQKVIAGNRLLKHQSSQPFNQLTSESLSQSQVKPPSPSKPKKPTEDEPQVLIAEVVVNSSKGNLEDKLIDEVYRAIRTKPGHYTTRSQLQEDINNIFKTGYFSNVQAIPEDTPLGVRVKFEVIPNPILVQIQLKGNILKTLQVKEKEISLQEAINNIFSKQYGQTLNLNTLQAGIKELIQIYENNGYILAQVLGSPEVQENGVVILNLAEGIIESIQVKFLKKDSEEADANTTPVKGSTPVSQILEKLALEPGKIFNKPRIEAKISSLDLSEDVNISLDPRQDPSKVVVVINIINEYTALQRAAKKALDAEENNKYNAIEQFKTVLRLTQDSKSELEEAATLSNIANLYQEQGKENNNQQDYQQARDAYSQALTIFRKYKVRLVEVVILVNLGEVHRKLKEPEQALDYYSQALNLLHSIKDKPYRIDLIGNFTNKNPLFPGKDKDGLAFFLLFRQVVEFGLILDMTITYATLGDYQQAVYLLSDEFLLIQKNSSKFNDTVKSYINYYINNDDTKKFFEKYNNEINQTILQLPEIVARFPYSFIYSDLGDELKAKFQTEETRKKFLSLVQIWKQSVTNKEPDGATLYIKSITGIIDWYFSKQKDSTQLVLQIQQIIELLKPLLSEKDFKSFTPYILPLTQLVIAWLSESTDDEKFVLTLDQFILLWDSLDREITSNFAWGKKIIFYLQGDPYYRLGKYQEALKVYRQTLEALDSLNLNLNQETSAFISIIQSFIPNLKTNILLSLGKVYEALDEPENALTFYRQALDIPTQALDIPTKLEKNALSKAEARYGIAKATSLLNNISEALSQIEMAVKESENPSVTFNNLAKGSTFASVDYKYGYGVKKQNSEKKYSTTIGFGLVASTSLLGFTTDTTKPDPANSCNTLAAYFGCRQKYFELYISLLMQRHQQTASKEYEIQAFQASERARALTAQIFQNSTNTVVEQQGNNQPVSKSTKSRERIPARIRPANLSEIQQQLLDNNTLLLEYFLGEEKSYLWVVSRNSIKTYSLPKRLTIETKAKQFYDLLTIPIGRVRPRTTAKVGKELSEMILGPVAAQLGQKRLLIVGDGALQYIPFSVIPELKPINDANYRSPEGEFAPYMQPLVVNHEVINLLSASAMLQVRHNHSDRPTASMELAVFADPVLNREDERVNRTKNITAASDNSISDLEAIYPLLPGTKQEVEQILKFVSPDKRSEFLGFDASYQATLGSNLNKYRIIHFATHGFFNVKSPERSGVVLSAISKTGELQHGSIVPASTFNMDMSAADLVVLSGCRTGLRGELIREGLTGITGGLMSAGAERLVVSLWSVNDEATQKLMTLFYQNMFEKKLSPTQALRSAQLSLWEDSRWQTLYNWAGFTIYGEWN